MIDRDIPLDPVLARIAEAVRQEPSPFMDWEASRRRMEASAAEATRSLPEIEIASVEAIVIPSPDQPIAARIYRPVLSNGATMLFFHGGGYVLGSMAHADRLTRKLCRDTAATIVSVDYRLAPEHRFPAAHRDAVTAAIWATENLSRLGGMPDRMVLAGESAGANLAACAALELRDRGVAVMSQILVVPGLDFGRDIDALSASDPSPPMFTPADLARISALFLSDDEGAARTCPPSPLRARDLHGVAPALIVTAGHCMLRPEGEAYAQRLEAAGVPARVLNLADMFHPFLGMFDISPAAMRANDLICAAIRAMLEKLDAQQHA